MALVALLVALAVLVLPTGAVAKFTCEARGATPDGIAVRGLPTSPVAGRGYTLTVTLRDPYGPNPSPFLGAQHCGDAVGPQSAPGIDGSFRRLGGVGSRLFSLELRFPRSGPWALSLMDLDGSFYDFGLRDVRPASAPERQPVAAGAVEGRGSRPWLVAGGALALTAGLAIAARRRRG